jgi:hypothetical protein
MPDVTQVLSAIEQGDPSAAEQLLPLVYDELSRLASLQMAHDRPGETLDPTVLVHEAYLRLVGEGNRPATTTVVTSSRRPPPPSATSALIVRAAKKLRNAVATSNASSSARWPLRIPTSNSWPSTKRRPVWRPRTREDRDW